jgi:hypothetical protein
MSDCCSPYTQGMVGASGSAIRAVQIDDLRPADGLRHGAGPPRLLTGGPGVQLTALYGWVAKIQLPQPEAVALPAVATNWLTPQTRVVPVGGIGSGEAPA